MKKRTAMMIRGRGSGVLGGRLAPAARSVPHVQASKNLASNLSGWPRLMSRVYCPIRRNSIGLLRSPTLPNAIT